jgi:hypothetical protein
MNPPAPVITARTGLARPRGTGIDAVTDIM